MTENEGQEDFLERLRICFDQNFNEATKVIELGIQKTNGAVRTYCPQVSEYIRIAIKKTNDVDWVIPGEFLELPDGWADITISTEYLQHSEAWEKVLNNMLRMTKSGGLVILTCTNAGRSSYGTINLENERRQNLKSYCGNLWADKIVGKIKLGIYFKRHGFEEDSASNTMHFWGLRSNAVIDDTNGYLNSHLERLAESQRQLAAAATEQASIRAELEQGEKRYNTLKTESRQNEWLLRMERMNAEAESRKHKSKAETLKTEALKSREEAEVAKLEAENARSEALQLKLLLESSNNELIEIRKSTTWRLLKGPRKIIDKAKKINERWHQYICDLNEANSCRNDEEKLFLELHRIDQHQAEETNAPLQHAQIVAPVMSPGYTGLRVNTRIDPLVKLIAFYLPQFHPFPENDQWWGKGFTEWYNVGKAFPNFDGHYQPHCPIHLGYYDLRIRDTLIEQSKLAKAYGIYGFSYYFYWFAGKVLMELPLQNMLEDKRIDMPFCLTWANENWTRRWDGAENDILISQEHGDEDSIRLIEHLIQYFEDSRYIRIDSKPLLIVYRADIIPEIKKTANLWREHLSKKGIKGLYLVSAQTFGITSPCEFDFDASVEFPPHALHLNQINTQLHITNKEFDGEILSYDEAVDYSIDKPEPEYKLYKTAMLSWDNSARKQNNGKIFQGFSLESYKRWLRHLCTRICTNDKFNQEEKLVFINAWNEWAEGSHLEPDRRFGYGYLQATYDVVSDFDHNL
jgi:SAM-dependent methyltransferase